MLYMEWESWQETYHYEKWRSEEPTEAKVHRRHTPGHLFDVIAQPSHAVKPGYGNHLEEGQEHDGPGRGVVIYQLEEINTTLRGGRKILVMSIMEDVASYRLEIKISTRFWLATYLRDVWQSE